MNRTEIYNRITQSIVLKLKEGVLPWRKSWKSGLPANFITSRPYKGINYLSLACEDYPSPYYLTFLQCQERQGKILAREKGSLIVFGP